MTDFPFAQVVRKVSIMSSQGFDAYQKFTCSGCARRVTRPERNQFSTKVTCTHCKAETDVGKTGCNFEIRIGPA